MVAVVFTGRSPPISAGGPPDGRGETARRAGGCPVYAAAASVSQWNSANLSFWSHSLLTHFQPRKRRPLFSPFLATASTSLQSRPQVGQVGRSPELTADGVAVPWPGSRSPTSWTCLLPDVKPRGAVRTVTSRVSVWPQPGHAPFRVGMLLLLSRRAGPHVYVDALHFRPGQRGVRWEPAGVGSDWVDVRRRRAGAGAADCHDGGGGGDPGARPPGRRPAAAHDATARRTGDGQGEAPAGGSVTGGGEERHQDAPQDRQTTRSGQTRSQVFSPHSRQRRTTISESMTTPLSTSGCGRAPRPCSTARANPRDRT